MVQTVIFDFDMTLVDSIAAITTGLNSMARHFNLPEVDESDTRRVMCLEAKEFWFKLWGYHDDNWKEFFLKEVAVREKELLKIFPGAEELLKKLKNRGFGLALATNRDNAWAALTATGLAKYFDTAVGCSDVLRGKPAPDMLLMAMEQLKADPGQTLYIGDAVSDIEAAVGAGIRGVGMLHGGIPRQDLLKAGAWQVREDLNDLADLFDLV